MASGVSSSIHFRGKDSVLKGYRDRNVEAWSLWQARQFLTKGMDEGSLEAFLAILVNSGSTAVYTLCVYEDVSDIATIKSKTDHDGSFNFRLCETDPVYNQGGYSSPLALKFEELNDKFNKLMDKLTEEEEEDEEEERDYGILGTINNILQDPDKLQKVVNVGKSIFGREPTQAALGNVTRIEGPAAPLSAADNEARVNRLGAAVDILEQKDPQLVEHLEMLAKIAKEKPAQFKTLLSMLEMY